MLFLNSVLNKLTKNEFFFKLSFLKLETNNEVKETYKTNWSVNKI